MLTPAFPQRSWTSELPTRLGLQPNALRDLAEQVGGCGCVIRFGRMAHAWGDIARSQDVASACKPVISTLLWMAIQENRLQGPDALASDWEPGLKLLNAGKDAAITFRHLAGQTSGYGLREAPGFAYSYNDFALALYYDTLINRVFQSTGSEVLRMRVAEPLGFEDSVTFNAFGPT